MLLLELATAFYGKLILLFQVLGIKIRELPLLMDSCGLLGWAYQHILILLHGFVPLSPWYYARESILPRLGSPEKYYWKTQYAISSNSSQKTGTPTFNSSQYIQSLHFYFFPFPAHARLHFPCFFALCLPHFCLPAWFSFSCHLRIISPFFLQHAEGQTRSYIIYSLMTAAEQHFSNLIAFSTFSMQNTFRLSSLGGSWQKPWQSPVA